MSTTHRVGLLLLVGFAFILGNTFARAQAEKAEPTKVQKWEHKTATSMTDELNVDWGAQGWELVTVHQNSTSTVVRYYFKRPKL